MDLLQVAVTSVGAFVALFLLSKLMGHRQISELSVFDYVNGITIGSIAAEMATELEKPLRPLVAMVAWALLVWLLRQLRQQGYHSAREVFLAVADANKQVAVYPVST